MDKGWENGFHIHLRGASDGESLHELVDELEKGTSESLSDFNEADFIRKYESVAKTLRKSAPFKPINKNKVLVTREDTIFNKEIEDELFRETNHTFDVYYCKDYFNKHSFYQVLEEAMKFHYGMEKYEEPGSSQSLAYNCHLSHYIAFVNRLNERDKKYIKDTFKLQFEKDLEKGLFEFDLSQSSLTKNLMNFFYKIRPLVKRKQLDFYMPFSREHVDEKLSSASRRHQVTYAKDTMRTYLRNDVAIANKWVTNALYKKLLLLGLSNLDRFYMNYVVSRLTYPERELSDYE